jgi:hypothetical protein
VTDLEVDILEMISSYKHAKKGDIEKAGETAFLVFYFILIFKLQGFSN